MKSIDLLRATRLCVGSFALTLACSHAKSAADAQQESQAAEQGSSEGDAEAAPNDPEKARTDSNAERRQSGGGPAEDIPVATSPQGLLKPGAEDKVREKLGMKKGDPSMRNELRRFQREHELPATGMLDHETVEQLGLDPDDIFEKEAAATEKD